MLDYYERNTRLFLLAGGSRRTLTIHRAVWGSGVTSRAQALHYTDSLVFEEARKAALPDASLRLLDLGCGVGGSLFYLLQAAAKAGLNACADGVTISPAQARMAAGSARQLGLSGVCTIHAASYLDLPPLPPADLAFAIESFVHGPDPARFFASAAGAIRPGGRLVIVDDHLSDQAEQTAVHPHQVEWITRFRDGWHASSLVSAAHSVRIAAGAGFALVRAVRLTPLLRLSTPRDRVVALAVTLNRLFGLRGAYLDSLSGGHALQQGLKNGVFDYQMLVYEKQKAG